MKWNTEAWVTVIALSLSTLALLAVPLYLLLSPILDRRRLRRILLKRERQWAQEMREIRDACRKNPPDWL